MRKRFRQQNKSTFITNFASSFFVCHSLFRKKKKKKKKVRKALSLLTEPVFRRKLINMILITCKFRRVLQNLRNGMKEKSWKDGKIAKSNSDLTTSHWLELKGASLKTWLSKYFDVFEWNRYRHPKCKIKVYAR